MDPVEVVRFRVEGRVQGVFFRQSTLQKAIALGIRGYVRNLADGSVEVMAAGSLSSMAKLRDWLQTGPPQARVDRLTEKAGVFGEIPSGFVIRY
jgi:acylphosphatase